MKTLTRILPCFALASVCGLLFVAPSVNAASIVLNGGFEANIDNTGPFATAPLTNWTVGEVLGVPATPNQNRVDGLDPTLLYALAPHTGRIAAAFNSTTNTVVTGGVATLTQGLATTAQTYDLSFWLANPIQDASNFHNIFSVSWNGILQALSSPFLTEVGITKTYRVTPQTTWFQVNVNNLLATGAVTNLQFSGRNSDWATLLDDVSAQASGVPDSGGTIAFLGLALAGLVLFSRKAQRADLA